MTAEEVKKYKSDINRLIQELHYNNKISGFLLESTPPYIITGILLQNNFKRVPAHFSKKRVSLKTGEKFGVGVLHVSLRGKKETIIEVHADIGHMHGTTLRRDMKNYMKKILEKGLDEISKNPNLIKQYEEQFHKLFKQV